MEFNALNGRNRYRCIEVLKVEFTEDMAETLRKYFVAYEVEGVVTLESDDIGLWLRNPNGTRQFLGRAVAPALTRDELHSVH